MTNPSGPSRLEKDAYGLDNTERAVALLAALVASSEDAIVSKTLTASSRPGMPPLSGCSGLPLRR